MQPRPHEEGDRRAKSEQNDAQEGAGRKWQRAHRGKSSKSVGAGAPRGRNARQENQGKVDRSPPVRGQVGSDEPAEKIPSNLPLAQPGRGTKQTLVPQISILKVEATGRKLLP